MGLRLSNSAKLTCGSALKTSYPFSIVVYAGGQAPSANTLFIQQVNSANPGDIVGGLYAANGAKYAIDATASWGSVSAAAAGTPDISPTAYQLFVLVFTSASSRTIYHTNATGTTNTDTQPNANMVSHNQVVLTAFLNGTDFAEAHFYGGALTSANVTSLLGGAMPETITGWIDGWALKDYSAGGSYTSLSGARTLTASGAVAQSTIAHPVARVTPATSVTLSGPASGTSGSPSTAFSVGADGVITGTVIVTPSDGGAGGSFSPTTVSISSGTPTATFTYTAASTGAKTISVTNNGGLTNPASLTYTAGALSATAVTLSGPSSGLSGAPSGNFTVGANGPITGTLVVTPSDGGAGGAFTPSSMSISNGAPTATFTYTPASAGAKTVSVTNNGGLGNPASLTYTASASGTITSQPLLRNNGSQALGGTLSAVVVLNAGLTSVVVTKSNVSVNASGVFTVSDPGISTGTRYKVAWIESTGQ